jgi:hypothetical protein
MTGVTGVEEHLHISIQPIVIEDTLAFPGKTIN